MNQRKFRSLTVTALLLVLALTLSLAIGLLAPVRSAKAVEYLPRELFAAGSDTSIGTSDGGEDGPSYVQFTFNKEETEVYFRRDLALRWQTEEETDGASSVSSQYYNMTVAFPEINFTRFIISYESVEENVSKKGTATNSLVFFYEESKLSVAVRDAAHQRDEDVKEEEDDWYTAEADKHELASATGDIAITLDEQGCGKGEYAVYINGEPIGKFTNVGAYFMEYLSSASSTPRDPITFRADKLGEDAGNQLCLVKELNRQSLEINDSGRVTDSAAPVLVINEAIYAYSLGRRWSLNYEAIDVCDSSVTITRRYAMIEPADETTGLYSRPTDTDYQSLSTTTVFMPTSDAKGVEQFVSIYFDLDDGRTETNGSAIKERVYLHWYAVEEAVDYLDCGDDYYECPVCGYRMSQEEYDEADADWKCPGVDGQKDHADTPKSEFVKGTASRLGAIKVDRAEEGPAYIGIEADTATKTNALKGDAVRDTDDADGDGDTEELLSAANYQKTIDELTLSEDEDGNVKYLMSAGDGSYFYLPSLRDLIGSDIADYRNLRFSIYYKKMGAEVGSTPSSATSLNYNALRFEIDEEGKYVFKVAAADKAGNAMQYYIDGKLTSLSASNIWDVEEIPEFHFTVGYNGARIEDPGSQPLGYRDKQYSIASFDVIALEGYDKKYTLYRLNEDTLLENHQERPEYSEFVKNIEKYVEEFADSLDRIYEFDSSVSEDDPEWSRTHNAYHWAPDSSLSFVPQETGYYVVALTVSEESRKPGHSVTKYQAIDVRPAVQSLSNPTEWIENNVTSVVLFSISAVLLIVIVVLFVVKPSDKNVEEVDLEKLKGKKKK